MRVGKAFGLGLVGAAAVMLAACTSGSGQSSDATDTTDSATTAVLSVSVMTDVPSTGSSPGGQPLASSPSAATTIISTVTQHQVGSTVLATPPASTAEPAPVAGECPYLAADVVSDITGQRHGETQISATEPYPICTFYRSDGGYMAMVRIIVAQTPQEAIAAVDQHLPRDQSDEATKPEGWSGGLMSTPDDHSLYGVSKDKIAVIAEENELVSIKARNLATCAIYGAGLETGPAPEFCSVQG